MYIVFRPKFKKLHFEVIAGYLEKRITVPRLGLLLIWHIFISKFGANNEKGFRGRNLVSQSKISQPFQFLQFFTIIAPKIQ